jgi:hypothetical protein
MYATKAPTPEGNQRIKDYVPVEFLKYLGKERVQLWGREGKKSTIIEPNIALSSVVEKYIGPGIFLAPYDPFVPLAPRAAPPVCEGEKSAKDPNALPQYQLVPLRTTENKRRKQEKKLRRLAMEYHVLPGKPSYFSLCMQKAFGNLKDRRRVEFHIYLKQGQNKKHRSKPIDQNALHEMVKENLHFHPHVITKAMPELSGIIVDPQTNLMEFCWVIGPDNIMEDGGLKSPRNKTHHLTWRREVQFELDSQGRGKPAPLQKKEMNRKAIKYLRAQKLHSNMGTGEEGFDTSQHSNTETGEGLDTSKVNWKPEYK